MKYSKEVVERLYDLISEGGMSQGEMCALVGIAPRTFRKWREEKPEFVEMIKEAEAEKYRKRLAMAERGQRKLLEGYEYDEERIEYRDGELHSKTKTNKHVSPHATAVQFALKNLDERYNQPDRIDHTTKGEKIEQAPVTIKVRNAKSMDNE